jgi:hypothetical protein
MSSIISTKEIWVSDFSLSNDALEGKWIRQIFSEYCTDQAVSASDTGALLAHFNLLSRLPGAAGFCMSEEADLLSQWRGYADDGCGVSIGFNRRYFEELGDVKRDRNDECSASPKKVEYNVSRQKELIAEHSAEIFDFVSKGLKSAGFLS